MRVSAVLLLAWSLWAQPPGGTGIVFPSDSEAAWKAAAAKLLEAVCPGKVVMGQPPGCHEWCPEYTGFGAAGKRYDASLDAVTRGHFLSQTSEDGVLWVAGCEPHSVNDGGTILLTKESWGWSMLWEKEASRQTSATRCRFVAGEKILVCTPEYAGQHSIGSAQAEKAHKRRRRSALSIEAFEGMPLGSQCYGI
jgi:hypothetical protein